MTGGGSLKPDAVEDGYLTTMVWYGGEWYWQAFGW